MMIKVEQYDWDKLRPKQKPSSYVYKPKPTPLELEKKRLASKVKAIDPSIREYHDRTLKGFFKNL